MTTSATMDLQALLEKTTDSDFLRDMIGFTAQRLMDLEVESLTGAPHGSRNTGRLTQRNGYRDRMGNPCRNHRAAHSKAAQRVLFPRLPRTPPAVRKDAHRRDPGNLRPGRLQPVSR
jgi:hypothetical protein